MKPVEVNRCYLTHYDFDLNIHKILDPEAMKNHRLAHLHRTLCISRSISNPTQPPQIRVLILPRHPSSREQKTKKINPNSFIYNTLHIFCTFYSNIKKFENRRALGLVIKKL